MYKVIVLCTCQVSPVTMLDMKNTQTTKTLTIIGAFIILIIIGFLAFRGNTNPGGNDVIKIGAALALSGDAAEWGEMSLRGAQLAVRDVNEAGGIDGSLVELVIEDTASSSRHGVDAVSKLVSIDKVQAIVGTSWLDVYHGPGEIAERSGLVMITPDSGTEALNDGKRLDHVYSTWYRVTPKAELLAETASNMGVEKIALLVPNDSYYIHFADTLATAAEDNNLRVVSHEVFNEDSDLRTEMLGIVESEADAVFFASYSEKHFAEYAKTITSIAPDIQLFGDEVTKDFIDRGLYHDGLDGVVYFHAAQPASSFVDDFIEEFDTHPAFGAATAYDAMQILVTALAEVGDPSLIDEYISEATFQTVSFGIMSFDGIGGVSTSGQQYDLFQLNNGTVQEVNF